MSKSNSKPIYQMPTASTAGDVAIIGASGIAGAKLSDGIAAALPDSTNSYKKWGIFGVSALLAMCFNPSTTGGKIAQSAFAGMAIKQGSDALSEALVPTIAAKTGGKWTDKFVNAVVGHDAAVPSAEAAARSALNSAIFWEPAEEVQQSPMASQPKEIPMFTGV